MPVAWKGPFPAIPQQEKPHCQPRPLPAAPASFSLLSFLSTLLSLPCSASCCRHDCSAQPLKDMILCEQALVQRQQPLHRCQRDLLQPQLIECWAAWTESTCDFSAGEKSVNRLPWLRAMHSHGFTPNYTPVFAGRQAFSLEKCNKNGFTFKLPFSKTYSLHQNRPGFASLPAQKEMNHSALRDTLTMKYHKHRDFQPEANFKHTLLNTYEKKTLKTYTENPKGIRLSSMKFHTALCCRLQKAAAFFLSRSPASTQSICRPHLAPACVQCPAGRRQPHRHVPGLHRTAASPLTASRPKAPYFQATFSSIKISTSKLF